MKRHKAFPVAISLWVPSLLFQFDANGNICSGQAIFKSRMPPEKKVLDTALSVPPGYCSFAAEPPGN
jgi:hypothetical protein